MKFIYASGTRPLDGYTLKRGIGAGGFGEVYFAVSDGGKEVALKRIQRNLDIEIRGVTQCLNLKHPNLVSLYDIKYDDQGEAWVVMEYVKGDSLRDVLEQHPHGLTQNEVHDWFRSIAAGVAYLHDHGIVHRDLKPGNIFTDEGLVKIGDYGLSKFISCSRRSGQTESVGTFHYMAPEIGRGSYGKEIDIYALGIVLYEILTGRVPFDGESSQEIIMKHLTADPDLSQVPQRYREGIRRALLKDPAKRFRTVAEMLSALRLSDSAASEVVGATVIHEEVEGTGTKDDPIYISDRPSEIVFGPVRSANGQPVLPPRSTPAPGAATMAAATAVYPSDPPEPIARAVTQTLRGFGNWWNGPAVTAPARVVMVIAAVFGLIFTWPYMFTFAMVLGPIYLVYFGIRSLVIATGHAKPAPVAQAPIPIAPLRPSRKISIEHAVRNKLRQRTITEWLGELTSSLLASSIIGGIVSALILLFCGKTLDGSIGTLTFFAWFAITTVASSWTLLSLGKRWEARDSEQDAAPRRGMQLASGLLVGLMSFGLSSYLGLNLNYSDWAQGSLSSSSPRGEVLGGLKEVITDGPHDLIYSGQGAVDLVSHLAFFALFFGLMRWWKQTDPLRTRRLSVWAMFVSFLAAAIVNALCPFSEPWGLMLAAAISLSTQLSAPWIHTKERQRIRQQHLEV